jgi:hypothetical protein
MVVVVIVVIVITVTILVVLSLSNMYFRPSVSLSSQANLHNTLVLVKYLGMSRLYDSKMWKETK